jgi:predicted  nucleic acid-binding Zn-ribbon protein
MPSFKTLLIVAILIIVAFGVGYGLGYMKLRTAEKEWAAVRDEMQSKTSALEKDLAMAKARVTLWEMPLALSQVSIHLSEKNFGLAVQSLDQLKETFSNAQTALGEEWKGKFDFFLPALEEIRNDAQNMNPQARKKVEDLKNRLEQALRSFKTS